MLEVVDSHFHIWDLEVLKLPWLQDCEKINRNYNYSDLLKRYSNFAIDFKGGVYIEVDCKDPLNEDFYINKLLDDGILAKVLKVKLSPYMRLPLGVAGVREPLHVDGAKPKRCLEKDFLCGLNLLGENNLVFEACMRSGELNDIYESAKSAKDTKIVINHFGNYEKFNKNFRDDMRKLANLDNIYLKFSGLKSGDKKEWKEMSNFAKETFGSSKILYSSNFPVIDLYANFDEYFEFLLDEFENDVAFFSKNAKKLYQINKIQRFGSVIRIRPEKEEYYKKLHKNPFDGINQMIKKCGITKYHIFSRNGYLFSYMEYNGDNFEWDMSQMAKDSRTQEWWKETDPCQFRIEGANKDEWWANMEEVYTLK